MSDLNPGRDRRTLGILVIIVIVILVPIGYYLEQDVMTANGPNGPGCTCFDGNPYVPAAAYNGTSQIGINLANKTAANGPIPSYAQIIKSNNTIVFHSNKIDLLVFAYPNFVAGALTGRPIPAYDCAPPCPSLTNPAKDSMSLSNSFTIYGLVLPSLVIPAGSTINITFVNMDSTDHHSFVISTFPPPYPEYIMQNMAVGGEMVAMTPLLPPIGATTAPVYQFTVTIQSSVTHMWYMCMYPDHAMMGMYGNITID
jgi:rusticyanin